MTDNTMSRHSSEAASQEAVIHLMELLHEVEVDDLDWFTTIQRSITSSIKREAY